MHVCMLACLLISKLLTDAFLILGYVLYESHITIEIGRTILLPSDMHNTMVDIAIGKFEEIKL